MERFPLWSFLLVYGGSIVLFLVSARYREPLLPVLFLYTACGAVWLVRSAIAAAWVHVLAGLAAGGAVYAATNLPEKPRTESTAYGLEWLALAANRDGRTEEAIELFRQAIELKPTAGQIRTMFGLTLLSAKRLPEAIAELEFGVQFSPYSVYALDSLADAYLQARETAKAGPIAERSIRLAPHLPSAYYALGRVRIAERRPFDAEELFRKAVERKPDYFNAAYALAMVSLDLGKTEQAIDALRRAVTAEAGASEEFLLLAHTSLVQTLASAGRKDEAREAARRMVERFPASEEARRMLADL